MLAGARCRVRGAPCACGLLRLRALFAAAVLTPSPCHAVVGLSCSGNEAGYQTSIVPRRKTFKGW